MEKKKLTLSEKQERVRCLRPIDDIFFEVLAVEPGVLQEMLRTILVEKELVVDPRTIVVQSSKRNLYGRSVRLDALCTLSDGTLCNVEVQRSDKDDHLRRVRYNASMITVKESQVGMHFDEVVNVCVVYISETDFLGLGRTIYHTERRIVETGTAIDDSLAEIFVNATINDRSEVAELMECFKQEMVDNPKFPALSGAVKRIKNDAKEVSRMGSVIERFREEDRKEAIEEGMKKGRKQGIKEGMSTLTGAVQDMKSGMSYEELVKKYGQTTADFAKACR